MSKANHSFWVIPTVVAFVVVTRLFTIMGFCPICLKEGFWLARRWVNEKLLFRSNEYICRVSCKSNLIQSAHAILMYASDQNGRLPHYQYWEKQTLPYLKNLEIYRCPAVKGRIEIKVSPPHESNTVKFKIDKRAQIVIVARSWVGATLTELKSNMCNRFTAKVYNHVHISLPELLQDQYNTTVPDTGQGCLIFYTDKGFPDCAHVGIQDGADIVDINCGLGHSTKVDKHPQSDLTNLYAGSQKKAPQELKDLDGE